MIGRAAVDRERRRKMLLGRALGTVCAYIFYVYGLAAALCVTVETFCTRVPLLRRAIDLVAAVAVQDRRTRARGISNAFEKRPDCIREYPVCCGCRVTGHLKGFAYATFRTWLSRCKRFENFKTSPLL